MMRKRIYLKKLIKSGAVLLSLAFTLGPAGGIFAAESGTAAAETVAYKDTAEQLAASEAAKELFTLEQIRDLARSKGSETLKAKSDLAIAQASKEAADMAVNDAWYNIVYQPMALGLEAALAQASAAQESASLSYDDAKATLETQMEVAAYTGENLFFSYLQLQDAIALLEKTIDLSQEQLKIEELKVKLGLSTETEALKKRLALTELTDKKGNLLNLLDMAGRSLMKQIGKADDTPFRLDPAYSIEGLQTVYDPDQLADLTVKNNLMLGVLNRSIDKLGDAIDAGMAYSQKIQIGSQRDSLILTRDTTAQAMRLLARTAATGLNTARTDMTLMEKKIEDKKNAYEVMTLQVSLGLAPKIGLAASEMDLRSAENDLKKAKQDYYMSLRKAALLVKGIAIMPSSGGGSN